MLSTHIMLYLICFITAINTSICYGVLLPLCASVSASCSDALRAAGVMPRVFIGRSHDLYGKSLWELLCNLKEFGAGRVVKRTKFNRRYPEDSWYRVISARPEMDEVRRPLGCPVSTPQPAQLTD